MTFLTELAKDLVQMHADGAIDLRRWPAASALVHARTTPGRCPFCAAAVGTHDVRCEELADMTERMAMFRLLGPAVDKDIRAHIEAVLRWQPGQPKPEYPKGRKP